MVEPQEVTVRIESYSASEKPHSVSPDDALWIPQEWGSSDQRSAVCMLVRYSLIDLMDRVEEWVPESLTLESGNRLGVTVTLSLEQIDKVVVETLLENSKALERARAGLINMRKQLND